MPTPPMTDQDRLRYFRNEPRRVPLAYAEHAGDKQFATTLARGIELLRCFSAHVHPHEGELSNAEIAQRTGLPRPTVSRLTYTLCVLGYLRQNPRSGRYAPGSALISVTYPLMASIGLRQRARALMNELADATGGQVAMGIRDRLSIVLVETSRSPRAESRRGPMADIGLSLPIAGSAIGRAYLAGCDAPTREALLNEIRIKTPEDWARFEPGVHGALRDHARLGFCAVDGSLVDEVVAVAAAYGPTPGAEMVVFNCAFLRSALPGSAGALRSRIGPQLVRLVQRLRDGSQP